jgi:2-polyprenyl-3-methyl-5-hydroxy-6-metoxy-1,4-benzoquinol methylase
MDISGYKYDNPNPSCAHPYLLPAVKKIIDDLNLDPSQKKIFDLGCGNGSVAAQLSNLNYDITGVDPSTEGITQARHQYPHLKLFQGSAYDNLADRYGTFPVVISLEVVEHLYDPRKYARCIFSLLKPGGTAIISTPYHSYLKNMAMALTGKMEAHFTVLWDNGHIKFFSQRTLRILLAEAGFINIEFKLVGRIPAIAKSMIAVAKKPA